MKIQGVSARLDIPTTKTCKYKSICKKLYKNGKRLSIGNSSDLLLLATEYSVSDLFEYCAQLSSVF